MTNKLQLIADQKKEAAKLLSKLLTFHKPVIVTDDTLFPIDVNKHQNSLRGKGYIRKNQNGAKHWETKHLTAKEIFAQTYKGKTIRGGCKDSRTDSKGKQSPEQVEQFRFPTVDIDGGKPGDLKLFSENEIIKSAAFSIMPSVSHKIDIDIEKCHIHFLLDNEIGDTPEEIRDKAPALILFLQYAVAGTLEVNLDESCKDYSRVWFGSNKITRDDYYYFGNLLNARELSSVASIWYNACLEIDPTFFDSTNEIKKSSGRPSATTNIDDLAIGKQIERYIKTKFVDEMHDKGVSMEDITRYLFPWSDLQVMRSPDNDSSGNFQDNCLKMEGNNIHSPTDSSGTSYCVSWWSNNDAGAKFDLPLVSEKSRRYGKGGFNFFEAWQKASLDLTDEDKITYGISDTYQDLKGKNFRSLINDICNYLSNILPSFEPFQFMKGKKKTSDEDKYFAEKEEEKQAFQEKIVEVSKLLHVFVDSSDRHRYYFYHRVRKHWMIAGSRSKLIEMFLLGHFPEIITKRAKRNAYTNEIIDTLVAHKENNNEEGITSVSELAQNRKKHYFQNGAFDLQTKQLIESSYEDYNTGIFPFNYRDVSDDDPVVLTLKKWLHDWLLGDENDINFCMSLLITMCQRRGGEINKIVLFSGAPGTGKSSIGILIESMLKHLAASYPTKKVLDSNNRFSYWDLYKYDVARFKEFDISPKSEKERILNLCGNDTNYYDSERKGVNSVREIFHGGIIADRQETSRGLDDEGISRRLINIALTRKHFKPTWTNGNSPVSKMIKDENALQKILCWLIKQDSDLALEQIRKITTVYEPNKQEAAFEHNFYAHFVNDCFEVTNNPKDRIKTKILKSIFDCWMKAEQQSSPNNGNTALSIKSKTIKTLQNSVLGFNWTGDYCDVGKKKADINPSKTKQKVNGKPVSCFTGLRINHSVIQEYVENAMPGCNYQPYLDDDYQEDKT